MSAAELKPGLLKHKQAKKEEIAPEEQLLWENYDHMQILQEVVKHASGCVRVHLPFIPPVP